MGTPRVGEAFTQVMEEVSPGSEFRRPVLLPPSQEEGSGKSEAEVHTGSEESAGVSTDIPAGSQVRVDKIPGISTDTHTGSEDSAEGSANIPEGTEDSAGVSAEALSSVVRSVF